MAGRKRPYSARGRRDFGRTQGASKPACPAGQLPEGARVIMPPGPCVPFPGAGGTFPPARRPAARSPSEAAVATRTPSGASARTIGIVGIKCQAARGGATLIRRSRRWRAGPHPAFGHLLPRAGEGSCTSNEVREKGHAQNITPLPMRAGMGEGARRAGEGPSDSEGGGHRCWRTGPHPALTRHLLPRAGEGSSINPPSPAGGRRKMDGHPSARQRGRMATGLRRVRIISGTSSSGTSAPRP